MPDDVELQEHIALGRRDPLEDGVERRVAIDQQLGLFPAVNGMPAARNCTGHSLPVSRSITASSSERIRRLPRTSMRVRA